MEKKCSQWELVYEWCLECYYLFFKSGITSCLRTIYSVWKPGTIFLSLEYIKFMQIVPCLSNFEPIFYEMVVPDCKETSLPGFTSIPFKKEQSLEQIRSSKNIPWTTIQKIFSRTNLENWQINLSCVSIYLMKIVPEAHLNP